MTNTLSDLSAAPMPACTCLLCNAASWGAAPLSAGLDPQGALPQGAASSTVQALLATGTPRWGSGAVGSGATVTYSFMEQAPSYATTADGTGFATLSSAQRDAVRQAFAAWSSVANIFFVETSDSANSGQGGSIRIGTNRQSSSAAYAYYPSGSLYDGGGDIYLANNTSTNTSPTPGTYGYLTILHEIGHAIGLKHPGNYNATGGGGEPPYLSSAEDNYRYTLMSYNRHPSLGLNGLLTGPALYDIAAAQYLYGTNTDTRIGDDRYVFGSNSTPFSQAIWDAGGTDSIDAGGQASAVTIDLTPGAFSSIGPNGSGGLAVGNLAIATGVTIENTTGGAGNDILIGNTANNLLIGGAGDDTLTGGAGDDTLQGNGGIDTAVYNGSRSSYTVTVTADGATISGGEGTDTLTDVEYALFADTRISLTPPAVTAKAGRVSIGSSINLASLVTATDPAGGLVTQYELVDNTSGAGSIMVGGVAQGTGAVVSLNAAAFAGVTFAASALTSLDELSVRAYNGVAWSRWIGFIVSSRPANRPPTVQGDKTLTVLEGGPAIALGIDRPSDPDEGDVMAVTLARLPAAGTLRLANGTAVTAGMTLGTADLAGLTYQAPSGTPASPGSFAYTVTDSQGAVSGQTVTLRVTPLAETMAGFDPLAYLASNADLAAAFGTDATAAREHYLGFGLAEGRATRSFDPLSYLAANPDLAAAFGADPAAASRHYLALGRREGRPAGSFDPLAYLAANPDLAAVFGTDTTAATRHYLSSGQREGRSTRFDGYGYLVSNPDLAAAFGLDPAAAARHYVTSGRIEGRGITFDPLAYLAANPDLAAAFGTDTARAANHYLFSGRREGRGTSFDALSYLAANRDLAASIGNDPVRAQEHYIRYGRLENRAISFNAHDYLLANPDLLSVFSGSEQQVKLYAVLYGHMPRRDAAGFDALSYLAANPDLAATFGTDTAAATAHYQSTGEMDGRPTRFNALAYLMANPDLSAAFGSDQQQALVHFIQHGRNEPRPNPIGYVRPQPAGFAAADAGLLAVAMG
ncbi:protease [Azospirillum sp. INR13]|uniref:M10 family metallopeptidase C-terminal domain-containing protein n=1 Tax=Azospirillum sp. INR13 TaxID=2596919 RepID=UPI00189244CB|nr:M10 family metallopeptidase C-terminal domain-containing protein [Azospirillum sp. INR13]MBF5093525.1 protease [Azospirillum sp. INR13]